MPITLSVTSHQKSRLGPDSSRTFDIHGGTVGRAPDNDWVLPDPERFVSSRHATVEYERGRYYITDTSKNGVYLNDAKDPIGAGHPVQLSDDDRLRIGEYEIRVDIEAEAEDLAASGPYERTATRAPAATMTGAEPALESSAPAAEAPAPEATGGSGASDLSLMDDQPTVTPVAAAEDNDWDLFEAEEWAEEAPAVRDEPPPAPPQTPRAAPEDLEAFRALVQGLGLDPALIPPGSGPKLMRLCGSLLRRTLKGLIGVLKSRTDLKARFGLPQTVIEPSDNNPLKFSASIDEALRSLILEHNEAYLGPEEAVENAVRDIINHQASVAAATCTAFDEILDRFDPEELQEKFDRGLKRGAFLGAANKMKYWELYCELYQIMTQHAEGNFQRLFGEEFTKAYQAEMERLGHTTENE